MNNYNFWRYCSWGDVENVRKCLDDDVIDVVFDDNTAIIDASLSGHKEVVELLLADDRVDPTSLQCLAVRLSYKYGHEDVCRVLLDDERVFKAIFMLDDIYEFILALSMYFRVSEEDIKLFIRVFKGMRYGIR